MNTNEPTRNDQHRGDLELVQEVLRDSAGALERLIERLDCVPLILRERNVRSGSPLNDDELTDLTQETLTTVWSKLASFEGRASLETWVYSFCMHQMMNALRSKKRRPQQAGDEALDIPDPSARPAHASTFQFEHLHATLAQLSDLQQAVIRLRHFAERSFEEIAVELGLSESGAKTTYYRGMVRLRGLLAPHAREEFA